MKLSILAASAALALVCGATAAQAGCVQTRLKPGTVQKLAGIKKLPALGGVPSPSNPDSIVGLWKVVHYDQDGNFYFDGLEQWHSDGTEFELGNVPPAIGNICVGVWKTTGIRTYDLNHIGLDFTTDGASDGVFTLTASVRMGSRGQHFEGTEDVKIYDAAGNLVQEVPGTVKGDRISVQ
jgi:hypothetical protein